MTDVTYAIIITLLLFGLTLFQLALVLGAPIGKFAWGGQHAMLPRRLRIGSAISIISYGMIAYVVLAHAHVIDSALSSTTTNISIWVLFGYFTLGIIMNAISRSTPERIVMTPTVTILALCCLLLVI
jgi:hypothetical protein